MRNRLPLRICRFAAYLVRFVRRRNLSSSNVFSSRKQIVRSKLVLSTTSLRESVFRSSSNKRRILHARETVSSLYRVLGVFDRLVIVENIIAPGQPRLAVQLKNICDLRNYRTA